MFFMGGGGRGCGFCVVFISIISSRPSIISISISISIIVIYFIFLLVYSNRNTVLQCPAILTSNFKQIHFKTRTNFVESFDH